ncbi:phosducin-like 3 [Basidiobolus meristosporus CBS 931.73]|uniref:Phosducin-like 3 n=1 Tax=Basidiobolus meristosporus CBS 931.73 TaxID=1314790 RepID=A0A1Y1YRC0_9FUNG|nr:phosducin-like 3 [Basidiobolus meristosporus CBS 931.73]|eukprot:ORY00580.1 phosducin-like 3 [Basidiobolus meristosporus CBS 931.73]
MNPDEDTEWNDILRAKGILPPKNEITEEQILDALDEVIAEANSKKLEDKDLDELDELEDEEDERVLLEYRSRMAEMQAQAEKDVFGELNQISEQDFVKEVTEASKEVAVVVHLFKDQYPACRLMNAHLATLAQKYKSTKFVKIISDHCIHGYPDQNLPTLLIYVQGDLRKQQIGLLGLGGMNMKPEDLEILLHGAGAIEGYVPTRSAEPSKKQFTIYSNTALSDDEDSDY